MRFSAYMLGFLILIAGLSWLAVTMGAPTLYVVIGAVVLLGIGLIGAASNTPRTTAGGGVTVVNTRDDVI